MTDPGHIIHRLSPDHTLQVGLELPDRWKRQHMLALVVALCTVGLETQVGQAGMGGVDQVQVSNHSLVPQHAVSTSPRCCFSSLISISIDQRRR